MSDSSLNPHREAADAPQCPNGHFFVLDVFNKQPYHAGSYYYMRAIPQSELPLSSHDYRTPFLTFADARQGVKERLENQLEEARRKVAGFERQLAELETVMMDPGPLHSDLSGRLHELRAFFEAQVGFIRRGESTGKHPSARFGRVEVTVGYMSTKNLIVVTAPEYDPVNYTFDETACALLTEAVQAAFPDSSLETWNGVGFNSFSIRVSVPVEEAERQSEALEA